jgi:hypothetical protein
MTATASWTVEDSARLYRIEGRGDPYFGIRAHAASGPAR